MIDNRISELSENYVRIWNRATIKIPEYRLDYSYQSVSILGLLSTPFIGDPLGLRVFSYFTLKNVAAYIAIIAHNCWQAFATDVFVYFDQRSAICISGKLRNGKVISFEIEKKLIESYNGIYEAPENVTKFYKDFLAFGEKPLIKNFLLFSRIHNSIKNILTKRLEKLKRPIDLVPVIGKYSRLPQTFDNKLLLFCLGLFYGSSSLGNEICQNRKLSECETDVENVSEILAQSCISCAKYISPDSKLYHDKELYLSGLIYPPVLVNEEFVLQNAINGFVEFIKRKELNLEQALSLCSDLMQSVDFTFSNVGFIVFSALTNEVTPLALRTARTRTITIGQLRPSLILARKLLTGENDWLDTGFISEEYFTNFQIERELGFLSWLILDDANLIEIFKNSEVDIENKRKSIVRALVNLNSHETNILFANELLLASFDEEFELQKIYFELMILKNPILAAENCRKLADRSEDFDKKTLFKLWGQAEILNEEKELAYRHLFASVKMYQEEYNAIENDLTARNLRENLKEEYFQTVYSLMMLCTEMGKLEEAEEYSALAYHLLPERLPILRYSILKAQQRNVEAEQLLKDYTVMTPFETSLFLENANNLLMKIPS